MDLRPLRAKAFRRLWLSTIVTGVGSQLTAVAVPKQIFDITQSSTWVGLSALAALIPLIVFALWGGAIADVVDRRKLMIFTNSGVALTSGLLWIQASIHLDNVAVIFVLIALQQAMFGMNQPARSASIPRLVDAEHLSAANALNTTVLSLSQVAGPLLAGVLIPILGLPTLYLLDTLALFAALWAVLLLPAMPPGDHVVRKAGPAEVFAGFKYLAAYPILLVSFLADTIAMVFGMPRALFPEMAQRTFGDTADSGFALAWLFAAIPIGAVAGGLFSGLLSHIHRQGAAVILAVCAWGAAVAAFGITDRLWLACLFLAIAGAADFVSAVFRTSILQTAATDEMRGRMQGVFLVVVAGGPRIADLIHGIGGEAFSTRTAVAGGGLLVIGFTIVMALLLPSFWRYRLAPTA